MTAFWRRSKMFRRERSRSDVFALEIAKNHLSLLIKSSLPLWLRLLQWLRLWHNGWGYDTAVEVVIQWLMLWYNGWCYDTWYNGWGCDTMVEVMVQWLMLWYNGWGYDTLVEGGIQWLVLWYNGWRMIQWLRLWYNGWCCDTTVEIMMRWLRGSLHRTPKTDATLLKGTCNPNEQSHSGTGIKERIILI